MKVTTTTPTPPAPPPKKKPEEEDDEPFWKDLLSGELLELLTRVQMSEVVESSRGVAKALKGVWKNARDIVSKILSHPVVDEHVSPGTENFLTRGAEVTAYSVGYASSGIQGLAGVYKLLSGRRQGDTGRMVDGLFDLATSAAIGVSVAGLAGPQSVLTPLAAGMGTLRGSYNAYAGHRKGDRRNEVQGYLDATRSTGTLLHVLSGGTGTMQTVSRVLIPVAGLLQVGRGYHDLSTGLRTGSNRKELWGLTDIATAVGMTLATTGIGTIPGIGLTVAASASRIAYQVHKPSRRLMDRGLDRIEPWLEKILRHTDRVVQPIVTKARTG
ncbi:MAG: hypothetical protein AB1758_38100 [Candidatus Eremiobacterota bacterium]